MNLLRNFTDLKGKKVLLRTDFDVPMVEGKIEDKTRIRSALPSINHLLNSEASVLIISHNGRPKGHDNNLSLKPVAVFLQQELGRNVKFLTDFAQSDFSDLNIFENIRFWKEEEENDVDFAKQIASFGDFYVNEAFAVSHRSHASIVGIPKLIPAFAGLHLEEELKELSQILKSPKRPLVSIIGGAKIETKLPSILNLAKVSDKVLVGGRLMFEVKENLPGNVLVAKDHVEGKDLGEDSIKIFRAEISKANMIVWNGPMGIFEEEKFSRGTREIAQAIANSSAYSIVGGGDSISALNKFELLDKMSYVSMGGGAMLEFLAGKKLPGLEALGYE